MAHPLVGKYGSTDLTALAPEDLVFVRAEIKDVLSGKGKQKLNADDRVILLRLWMETFEQPGTPTEGGTAQAAAPSSSSSALAALRAKQTAKPAKRLPTLHMPKFETIRAILRALSILRWPDLIFIACGFAVTIFVVMLGFHSMTETHRVEEVKREAEEVVAWIKDIGGDKRGEDNFTPDACKKTGTDTWKACQAALTAEGGPFAGKKNHFDESRDFFSAKCDMSNPDTVGTIIIEKGTIPLGSTSLAYSAFDGTETLTKDMIVRVIVCGRGFHLIKVATELTF